MESGRGWSEAEAGLALRLHRSGCRAGAIAPQLPQRSVPAIRAKLNRMGAFPWRIATDPFLLDLRGRLRARRSAGATPC